MRITTLFFCLLLFTGSILAQRPAQGPMIQKRFHPKKMGYDLVWEDQFRGKALDTTKWGVRGIGPRAIAFVSEEAVKVENGKLRLYALKKGDSLLGSAVGTQGKFMSKYGYYECRAKLQKSAGIWAAFWIQSTEISKGEDPGQFGAEIDIMEFFKKLGTDIVSHNVHWAYGPHQQTVHGMQSYRKGVGKGFHTFGVEWLPDRYIFYIDGYKYYEVTRGVSHIEEYMILSMEYPGKMEEIASTVFPDVFVVDYVKVYQKTD
ncbi:glycoside hydrolase family 16 protein [Flavobacteriaceae bacterium F89]|uniref:Glycoside hydrolase family 16 protein n=1 Tax=Cerina litoralis TaxID=2874477 RepID=A0AAE3JNY6_9FLAO|nr:glycoside hydrolase family 16 protein [Cerina litoralis]MCG2460229.1 glycoside hydrolase family 16 protein [Cerina litoralis]